jgi:nucleosome binding factor SPN SPT16 subunit
VEAVITDPSKIGLNVAPDLVDACYTPIIQSGGKYDVKISAQSDSSLLSPDVIICSLGAKYKGYCANVARTFMVNVPSKVENTYAILLSLFDACLEQMVPGKELKDVYAAAKDHLTKKDPSLVSSLPKSLGFAIGLEFRDSLLVLNQNNTNKFVDGMVFSLIVGLHNIALPSDEAKSGASALTTFSLLLSDTVRVQRDGPPEVLTKMSKDFGDVSYTISDDKDGDDEDDDEDDDKDDAGENGGKRRPSRRAKEEKLQNEAAAAERATKQKELMDRKISDALKKFRNEGGDGNGDAEDSGKAAVDLKTYLTPKDYPRDVNPMQVRVDMEKEALFLPINGRSVPFHVSTIKSVTRPEEDKATWMRVNFFVPGASVKEAPKNMQQLVAKYGGRTVFIKELTFRATNPRNLVSAYQMFQELRKRVKQREQKAEQEKVYEYKYSIIVFVCSFFQLNLLLLLFLFVLLGSGGANETDSHQGSTCTAPAGPHDASTADWPQVCRHTGGSPERPAFRIHQGRSARCHVRQHQACHLPAV